MSALDILIRKQVSGVFGEDVARMLSPEGMAELGDKVKSVVERYETMLNTIASNQVVLHKQNLAIMEALNIAPAIDDKRAGADEYGTDSGGTDSPGSGGRELGGDAGSSVAA